MNIKKVVIPLVAASALFTLSACGDIDEPASPAPATAEAAQEAEATPKATEPSPTDELAEAEKELDEAIEKAAELAKDVTQGEKNAVASAEAYLEISAFSEQGLFDQLVFEGYSEKEAGYAVGLLSPDWKEQAAKAAEGYQDISPMSRQGMIDQLMFEGFTRKQAEHGANAVGL